MSKPAVIITRAQPGADATAKRAAEMGFSAVLSPAISLHLVDPVPDMPLEGAQGIVFTSANGVRFFTQISHVRDLKAWCVGPSTLDAATAAGFDTPESADGDSEDLAGLIIKAADPSRGHLVHIANTAAGNILQTRLGEAGLDIRFVGLYEPREVEALNPDAIAALTGREPVCTLIHSAKGAAAFAKLIEGRGLPALTFISVSEKAAKPVSHLGQVRIAKRPNEDALLNTLNDWQLAL